MHYYQKNIGDYRRDTAHLTPLEHGIYNMLIDTYYLSEKPLTLDHADLMRTHCVRSAEEVQAFKNVLKDFFIEGEYGYSHKRCDAGIAKFHNKSEAASTSAKARWAKDSSQSNANAMRTHSEGNANQEPITNNQGTNNHKKALRGSRLPEDWSLPKNWGEWALQEKPLWNADHVRKIALMFHNYWKSVSGKAAVKLDWYATWQNWVMKESDAVGKQLTCQQQAQAEAPQRHQCGVNGCSKEASSHMSYGHRCPDHLGKEKP